MAAIWSEVLKLGHIGRDDNFFELGGHSLLVTQVVSRVRRRLDLQVPLRTLFEHSTLRAYAQAVAQLAPAAQGGIARCARDASPQLSFAQERQWFIWRLEPDSAAYNIPVALRLKGPLRRDALQGPWTCWCSVMKRCVPPSSSTMAHRGRSSTRRCR